MNGTRPPPTSKAASRRMRANHRVDTSCELQLRSKLHHAGLRFRKDHRIPVLGGLVRVDVAFTRSKVAVLVDGCFWHSCPQHGTMPKRNAGYWREKLETNVARDRRQSRALTEAGWAVVRYWEHEINTNVISIVAQIEARVR